MKAQCLAFALIVAVAGTFAAAQSTPQVASPAAGPEGQSPKAAPPAPSQQIPKEDSGGSQSATKARIKACIAEQRANNPALPKNDIEKYCESQVNGSPPG